MTSDHDKEPSADEIRDALRQVLASSIFTHAPRLGAFLRFVVEAVLAGQTDSIKGYTIAVGALGRAESFDPSADPIVRVEAGRLRRALSRYYGTASAAGAVVIELPLGSYVPVFYRAKAGRRPRGLLSNLRRRPNGLLLGGIAVALIALLVMAAFALTNLSSVQRAVSATRIAAPAAPESLLPILFVASFETVGASAQQKLEIDALRGRLRDALARFDEIEVASGDAPRASSSAMRSAYRLAGIAEYHNDTISLSLWLDDADEGTVAWTQTFEIPSVSVRIAAKDIVQQVATTLAQPYGVIYARELSDSRVDQRYRCLATSFEFRRWFIKYAGVDADSCLEELTALNPGFADGFAMRALLKLHRYYGGGAGSAAALEQAVMLAQKAVELKPQSARAREALMNALFAQGDLIAALTEGETAVSLNPNDMIVLHSYGVHLIFAGQAEKGASLVRRAAALSPVRPATFEFGLFIAAYVLGDYEKASAQARLFPNSDFFLILVARAVSAARNGDVVRAREAVQRLVALGPGWRTDPRKNLELYFPSRELVDRLLRDLTSAGISSGE